MSTISEDYICAIIKKIATDNNLNDFNFTREKFDSIGQNYFGVIIPVVIAGRKGDKEGKEIRIHLVLKLAPTDERFRVSGAVTAMFAREIFVYSVILKTYENLQAKFSDEYVIPRCYFVQKEYCKEAIGMQDMHADGYKPFTHEMFLDLDHIIVSLKSLAKLHALSFILNDRNPKLYDEIAKVCIPLSEKSNKRYMEIMKDRLNKAQNLFADTQYALLLEKLTHNCGKLFDATFESVTQTCICHGDIWKENILYKYKDNKPIAACLIDYQTSRICSPAFDTLYLIISSTDTDLRQTHYHQLLENYYQTFVHTLKEANLDVIYSRQMFEQDLCTVAPACFITANCALWLLNGLQEEGHVRSKKVWTTKEEKEMAVSKFKRIVMGMIDDLTSYGYLDASHF